MKNKDTLMLEKVYLRVLKEEMDDNYRNIGQENNKTENKEDAEKQRRLLQLEMGLGRSNPSVEQGNLLQSLQEKDIDDLINYLNDKGSENEDYWALKNNLIRQLFNLLKSPNV
jgi:hypothetical protein